MKKILPIGLLILLLYNTFGLSLAILFFEKDYQLAAPDQQHGDSYLVKMYLPSLPYSGDLDVTENIEGLVRKNGDFFNATEVFHENDTLYVTLTSNLAARDHFFELANAMERVDANQTDVPQNTSGKLIKLLNNLLKNYIPESVAFQLPFKEPANSLACKTYVPLEITYLSFKTLLSTPPPERA